MTQASAARMQACANIFLMEWSGGLFPQGAGIGGTPIGSIHGDVILSTVGDRIGNCEFVLTVSAQNLRQLVVATDAAYAHNPDGSRCKAIRIATAPIAPR